LEDIIVSFSLDGRQIDLPLRQNKAKEVDIVPDIVVVPDVILEDLLRLLNVFFAIKADQASALHHFFSWELFVSHATECIHNNTEDNVDEYHVDQDIETHIEENFSEEFIVWFAVVMIHHICDWLAKPDAEGVHEAACQCFTDINPYVITCPFRVKIGLQSGVRINEENSHDEGLCQSPQTRGRSF